jgi:hypothetical protein
MIHIVVGHSIQDHLHDMNIMYFDPFFNTFIEKDA